MLEIGGDEAFCHYKSARGNLFFLRIESGGVSISFGEVYEFSDKLCSFILGFTIDNANNLVLMHTLSYYVNKKQLSDKVLNASEFICDMKSNCVKKYAYDDHASGINLEALASKIQKYTFPQKRCSYRSTLQKYKAVVAPIDKKRNSLQEVLPPGKRQRRPPVEPPVEKLPITTVSGRKIQPATLKAGERATPGKGSGGKK